MPDKNYIKFSTPHRLFVGGVFISTISPKKCNLLTFVI